MVEVEWLNRFEALVGLEAEWRALEPRLPALPFNRFDWAVSWWLAFGRTTFKRRNELRVLTFRQPSGELVGVAPMVLTSWPAHGPFRARSLQFFGGDQNLTELRGAAFAPEWAEQCWRALFAELEARSGSWDWLRLCGLGARRELGALEAGAASRVGVRDIPNYVLSLPATWTELKGRLSRNAKEAIRKCYNAPQRDGVQLTFRAVSEASEIPRAIDRFLPLHAERSERSDTVPHLNSFARPESEALLRRTSAAFARDGRVRVFELCQNGQTVASRIGFALGDTLYLYYSGYRAELARYSVMQRLVCETLQYAIAHGFRCVNLSTGTDNAKLRWRPAKVVYRDVQLVSKSLRSRALYGAFTWSSRISNGALLPHLQSRVEEEEAAPDTGDDREDVAAQ